jgi:hypothetical protein
MELISELSERGEAFIDQQVGFREIAVGHRDFAEAPEDLGAASVEFLDETLRTSRTLDVRERVRHGPVGGPTPCSRAAPSVTEASQAHCCAATASPVRRHSGDPSERAMDAVCHAHFKLSVSLDPMSS